MSGETVCEESMKSDHAKRGLIPDFAWVGAIWCSFVNQGVLTYVHGIIRFEFFWKPIEFEPKTVSKEKDVEEERTPRYGEEGIDSRIHCACPVASETTLREEFPSKLCSCEPNDFEGRLVLYSKR
ncbi:hypothetical protein TNCT_32811 [Trichonephila clavata]|uniref:Uncharacterized protein n=1 Tax=Trichonephila clavata TaxID=2740835 RepID=A0A8X6EZF3_TRICU|nr:hypothetical protein TNCT_32811 [Trichonephila clavata]